MCYIYPDYGPGTRPQPARWYPGDTIPPRFPVGDWPTRWPYNPYAPSNNPYWPPQGERTTIIIREAKADDGERKQLDMQRYRHIMWAVKACSYNWPVDELKSKRMVELEEFEKGCEPVAEILKRRLDEMRRHEQEANEHRLFSKGRVLSQEDVDKLLDGLSDGLIEEDDEDDLRSKVRFDEFRAAPVTNIPMKIDFTPTCDGIPFRTEVFTKEEREAIDRLLKKSRGKLCAVKWRKGFREKRLVGRVK